MTSAFRRFILKIMTIQILSELQTRISQLYIYIIARLKALPDSDCNSCDDKEVNVKILVVCQDSISPIKYQSGCELCKRVHYHVPEHVKRRCQRSATFSYQIRYALSKRLLVRISNSEIYMIGTKYPTVCSVKLGNLDFIDSI